MPTLLPIDSDNNTIPAMRLKSGAAHKITSSGTSTRNSTAFGAGTQVVSLYATQDVYIKFGDSTVTAANTDHFFPAGIYYDVAIGNARSGHAPHLAVLQVTTGGTVYISEKE